MQVVLENINAEPEEPEPQEPEPQEPADAESPAAPEPAAPPRANTRGPSRASRACAKETRSAAQGTS